MYHHIFTLSILGFCLDGMDAHDGLHKSCWHTTETIFYFSHVVADLINFSIYMEHKERQII